MTESVEAVVVGAGVIGLAIARELARDGHEVVILEAERNYGTGTSSRNSEVIHAGLYYPKGSLKARLCVRGKWALYDYCRARNVGHRNTGKLVVATAADEVPILEGIVERAADNGVDDLQMLTGAQATALEPELRCEAALLSPSTGIVEAHGVMHALLADAEAAGAALALATPLEEGDVRGGLCVRAGGMELRCQMLINAAGLGAQEVAGRLRGLPPSSIPRRYLTKGSYFRAPGRPPFTRLIYPVPNTASLGIHVTLDLAGQVRFGPDQEWVESVNYDVEPGRAAAFYDSVRRYYPALKDGSLQPDYAGIRPKTQAPGEPMADFVLQGADAHGVPGLVNLYGMESPGLTACLAIAEEVAKLAIP